MHTFQPMPMDVLEFNPFTKIGKDWALVTAGTKEKANPMTVSWGGVGVLWGKNVAFIFIRDSRYTKELLDENEFFSLTFLSEQYRDALNYCGSHSGRNEDKFKGAGLTPAFRHGIPYVDEGNFVLICEKWLPHASQKIHLWFLKLQKNGILILICTPCTLRRLSTSSHVNDYIIHKKEPDYADRINRYPGNSGFRPLLHHPGCH